MNRKLDPDWPCIVQTYGGRVFAVAMRILGDVQDAEDVSQEVFLAAYKIHANEAVECWAGLLIRLSTLRALDFRRRNRPFTELFEQDCGTVRLDPADHLIRDELAAALRAAVSRLPSQQATVFTMTHFEQMTRDEIARSLGISPDSVSTSLYKARRQLSKDLSLYRKES